MVLQKPGEALGQVRGAISIEVLPGVEGLLHISEIDYHRVARTEDVLNVGDMVMVKVIGVDRDGKIKLSRKALLPEPEGGVPAGAGAGAGGGHREHGGRERGDRDRDRGRRR